MTPVIRPATAADQPAIKSIVRAARIAPYGLRWPRFLVAEDGGRIVGVGRVKPHSDGSQALPPVMARLHRLAAQVFRLGSLFAPLGSPILGGRLRIIAMRREP